MLTCLFGRCFGCVCCRSSYLASNSVAPQFENVELGIGDSVIKKALQEATGRNMRAINAALKATGDLGMVGWLVGRSVGWLVGRLVGWLAGWFMASLIELVGRFSDD